MAFWDQPTVADIEGRINNFIDVTDFLAYNGDKDFEKEKAAVEYGCCGAKDARVTSRSGPDARQRREKSACITCPMADDYTK
jgi:5'-AMP-activated protein kinase regulatory beta subunit